jgi:hypothetical protein
MKRRLDEVIRSGPRIQASEDFTVRVMQRVRTRPAERSGRPWRPMVASTALVVVSVLSGVAYENHRENQKIEALRFEARQIEAELEALKAQATQSSEVVLGGSENVEYVLDLRDLTAPSSDFQTVSDSY